MSGRSQALMRTRCPVCGTMFRVTSEQLRLKAGKVRCGHCQALFNAFDSLTPDETPAPQPVTDALLAVLPQPEGERTPAIPESDPLPTAEAVAQAWHEAGLAVAGGGVEQAVWNVDAEALAESPAPEEIAVAAEAEVEPVLALAAAPLAETGADLEPVALATVGDARLEPAWEPLTASTEQESSAPSTADETPEQSAQAAREAGLMAARDLNETPGFNRWAAGTLAVDGGAGFAPELARPLWPFVLVALLLTGLLLAQAAWYFRGDLARHSYLAARIYASAGVAVPLARNPDLVAIESSDLQSDGERGLFVLQATLKNRADYRQDWPSLELTLTDTRDAVVTRRVLAPVEYLPPGGAPEFFAADGEVAIRLWLEARGTGAAGYRLYVFYP